MMIGSKGKGKALSDIKSPCTKKKCLFTYSCIVPRAAVSFILRQHCAHCSNDNPSQDVGDEKVKENMPKTGMW